MAKVLLVDDDGKVRELISRFLSEAGHRVEAYASASQALLRLAQEDFDALIGEFYPSSAQILEQVAALDPTLPVLVLSRSDEPQARDHAGRSGASGYLVKPFDLARLLSWVEATAGGAAPRRSEITSSFPGSGRHGAGEQP